MDIESLEQSQFVAIQQLESNGLVDDYFRECYKLKQGSCHRFFLDLISDFSTDVGEVVTQIEETLNKSDVDFNEINELRIKLLGSAACIGACRVSAVCSFLRHGIRNRSKEECLHVLNEIKHEYKDLKSHLNDILKVEQELISIVG